MAKGWIMLHREIQDCWVAEDKPYNYMSAWIDLLLLANHKETKLPFGNEIIPIERGSFITSKRKLAERWGWSNKKVDRFIKLLESDEMLVAKSDTKKTLVTIVNYDFYQDREFEKRHQSDTKASQERHEGKTKATQKHTNNNDKNDNNVNNDKNENNNIYQHIVDMYNSTCVSLSSVKIISEKRKKAISARLKKYSEAQILEVFGLAEESDFLKGQNNRNWTADFDWLMNDNNMAKVLEGKYKNKPQAQKTSNGINWDEV